MSETTRLVRHRDGIFYFEVPESPDTFRAIAVSELEARLAVVADAVGPSLRERARYLAELKASNARYLARRPSHD